MRACAGYPFELAFKTLRVDWIRPYVRLRIVVGVCDGYLTGQKIRVGMMISRAVAETRRRRVVVVVVVVIVKL